MPFILLHHFVRRHNGEYEITLDVFNQVFGCSSDNGKMKEWQLVVAVSYRSDELLEWFCQEALMSDSVPWSVEKYAEENDKNCQKE